MLNENLIGVLENLQNSICLEQEKKMAYVSTSHSTCPFYDDCNCGVCGGPQLFARSPLH